MRAAIQPYNGKKVTGFGQIAEIGQKFILLRYVRINQAEESDHYWIPVSALLYICEGEWIQFKALVTPYWKRDKIHPKRKQRVKDYQLKILDWAVIELALPN
jgi:hypothetical protein